MANCMNDMRERTSSFDLHDIGKGDEQPEHTKKSFLAKLFRSISESSMKKKSPSTSPATSPKASPGGPRRRRFVRVIKNDDQVGEEYVNPHVVRKYEKGFWENKYMKKSASLDEPQRPLPYTVSGPTILKKAHSVDSEHPGTAQSSPVGTPPSGHIKFKEEVEIIEYDIKGKCLMIMNDSHVLHEKLHDQNYEFCIDMELLNSPRSDVCPLKVTVEPSDITETNYKLEALEVIDENNPLKSELVDDVFASDDSSETDSASESCDECGHEKVPKDSDCENDEPQNSEHPSSPTVTHRQNSDEGISAPKKCRIASSPQSTSDDSEQTSAKTEDTPVVAVEQ